MALLGVLSLLAFLIIGLADIITNRTSPITGFWTSALIIGVLFTATGGFQTVQGKDRLLGRRDEAQHQPARPSQYFGPLPGDDRGGHNIDLMALLLTAAKPLVSRLAHHLAERHKGNGR